jgi:hypothetical protein
MSLVRLTTTTRYSANDSHEPKFDRPIQPHGTSLLITRYDARISTRRDGGREVDGRRGLDAEVVAELKRRRGAG